MSRPLPVILCGIMREGWGDGVVGQHAEKRACCKVRRVHLTLCLQTSTARQEARRICWGLKQMRRALTLREPRLQWPEVSDEKDWSG